MIDSIDAYLAELGGGIINRKKRSLLPIVRERAQLADSFTRRLVALGLERRVRDAPDLGGYLAAKFMPTKLETTHDEEAGATPPEPPDADEGTT